MLRPAESSTVHPIGVVAATSRLLVKDVVLEWKSRARLNATLFFALLTLLLFSFAVGPHSATLAQHAAGFLWLAVFLSSVLALSESMRLESDNDALDGLRLLPVPPLAVFLGKAAVNAVYLFILGVLMVPIALAIYGAQISTSFAQLALILFLGAGAISAPGTLFATIAMQARARDVLLPLLLFPILVPGLLAAVKATTLVMQGDPMAQLDSWRALLIAFNIIYWLLCSVLFGRIIEE